MAKAELAPKKGTIAALLNDVDERYSKPDAEKACYWAAAIAEFSKRSSEMYNGLRYRFPRCTRWMAALRMKRSDRVIYNADLQDFRLPGSQLPSPLSALGTKRRPPNVLALNGITIRMFAIHRSNAVRIDVFTANAALPPPTDRELPNDTTNYIPPMGEYRKRSIVMIYPRETLRTTTLLANTMDWSRRGRVSRPT